MHLPTKHYIPLLKPSNPDAYHTYLLFTFTKYELRVIKACLGDFSR